MKKLQRQFSDVAVYSSEDKTAISVRDGVLEYLGAEIGLEPHDKVFTVYRSPATIANVAHVMSNIALTDDHVSLDMPPPDTGSVVTESVVVDKLDECTNSRLAVKNKLKVSDAMRSVLENKRQLSLGYRANLIPHSRWDFEQVDIVPHHLAAVEAGRCGPGCSFLDRKTMGKTMSLHKAFLDAEGAASLEQIVAIATGLPDAMKKVPIDELQKILPALQEIMSYAKSESVEMPEDAPEAPMDAKDEDESTEEPEKKDEPVVDADMKDEEKDKKFSDADMKAAAQKFADAEVKRYAVAVNKAKNFLDDSYDFSEKTASDIMRDALSTQTTDKFEDSELDIAFKLLRKSEADYSNFGDSKADSALLSRIEKDLEA